MAQIKHFPTTPWIIALIKMFADVLRLFLLGLCSERKERYGARNASATYYLASAL